MDDADETLSLGRRTRSATKAKVTVPKSQRPKPLSKKTRKKVVMESEAFEAEEEQAQDSIVSEKSAESASESPEKPTRDDEDDKHDLNGKSKDTESGVFDSEFAVLNTPKDDIENEVDDKMETDFDNKMEDDEPLKKKFKGDYSDDEIAKTEDNSEHFEESEEQNVGESEKLTSSMETEKMTEGESDDDNMKTEKSDDENVENIESVEESEEQMNDNSSDKQKADPDAENISEDELPSVQAVKVPEAEEVSDEELPGPKRAELPADTEVVSEDELPTVKTEKKESAKRKLNETDYDPGSPTSEGEAPAKKPAADSTVEKDKEEPKKPKKLPELDKYWKAVNDDPTDFTGWTYLLQYVDQENDMEAAREAYDAFLSHYPYCYGYWRKYADYEKRKGNKKKCEEVFERGLKAIPLSVDLWLHYLTYVKSTRAEDEEFVRSQFERAVASCGLEFRSDRLWDSYVKWETEGKRLQRVTAIYDRLLATPTQGYTSHFDNFQEHVAAHPPNKVVEIDEFLALRKEIRQTLKQEGVATGAEAPVDSDAPPGDEDQSKMISTDEETKSIRERIVSIRRKLHKATVNAVTARWNYEEGIKRPYFHVKPLERCQLKNWQDYLDYETEQGDKTRIIVLFERCLIACALYEDFWLKFVHYLESLNEPEFQAKIRDVYERACTIHHLKKPNLHLQWAMFEEGVGNAARAAEILVNLEKSVPNVLQIAYRRINLERRRGDHEKCVQLYEHYINNSKNKMISSSISIKYSRFCFTIIKDMDKAQEVLKSAIGKDHNNPRLYLQLIDLTLQKENVTEKEVMEVIDMFLEKDNVELDQKMLFAQRKLEYLEDFGSDIQSVQSAYEQYQKLLKLNKDGGKKKDVKSSDSQATSKSTKDKPATPSSQSSSYGSYGQYGTSGQASYAYSGNQQGPNYYPQYGQGDQYQYQNWQYPQGGYGGYNQWGGYGGSYGY
ncbi:unnamed protein product [Phyllotreta striolata]|uniref:Pre-mRNA-processing factor 39 n=1 Tax=Phyllotreta striolata TaxID=444603 RepID=A0A9N9TQW3_PHYSR|nr:unnamed protein product [Phyllotreta striolata]